MGVSLPFTMRVIASAAMLGLAAASGVVDGASLNKPNAGPDPALFTASSSINIAAIQAAAQKASKSSSGASFPVSQGSGAHVSTIHNDWVNFADGAAFVFIADMDVDCDGIDYKCTGNGDGQSQTDWGALAAYEVPWIVIPDAFRAANSKLLSGNNVAAVICGGKMFYGIYGDSDGDSPQVIGEASWLMARTCFPNDNLNGGVGHTPSDVTYIVFVGSKSILPSSAFNNNYITNFDTLRNLGDQLVTSLSANLNIAASGGGSGGSGNNGGTGGSGGGGGATPACSWAGHCAGASCSTNDDCSDDLVCGSGKCTS